MRHAQSEKCSLVVQVFCFGRSFTSLQSKKVQNTCITMSSSTNDGFITPVATPVANKNTPNNQRNSEVSPPIHNMVTVVIENKTEPKHESSTNIIHQKKKNKSMKKKRVRELIQLGVEENSQTTSDSETSDSVFSDSSSSCGCCSDSDSHSSICSCSCSECEAGGGTELDTTVEYTSSNVSD